MMINVALIASLAIAGVAAIADWRTGRIANWITIPAALGSPLLYAFLWGPRQGALSAASLLLCSLVPYGLFRLDAMGGGDVKLFAALGASTGFDLRVGLEIELMAFLVGTFGAVASLLRRGVLFRTLRRLVALAVHPFRPSRVGDTVPRELLTPVRLGVPILIGTMIAAYPILLDGWVIR